MNIQRLIILVFVVFAAVHTLANGKAEHTVLVVWDGMRPDFVSPELTPTLWQLRTNGVWFANHHSAYPTSTKVNGATLATGLYPQHHNILGNSEYRPQIDPFSSFGTDNLKQVRLGDALMGNKYLGGPTLAELVAAQRQSTAVAGTKEVALFQDRLPRADTGSTNPVLFRDDTLPHSLWDELVKRLGKPPESKSPNEQRDLWTTRALTRVIWEKQIPRYSLLWLSEPDLTQHKHGPGSREALDAIRGSDRNLAHVLDALAKHGKRDKTDLIVISDHGFSSITANADVKKILQRAGLKVEQKFEHPPRQGDILMVGLGGSALLYVIGHGTNVIQRAVTALQQEPTTGVICTRLALPGTFPLSEVRLDAPHAPDIVISFNWNRSPVGQTAGSLAHEANADAKITGGTHTSLSPFDTHNLCVAAGPDFRVGVTNTTPTGNIDIMPTISWLLGITPKPKTDGRVMMEVLTRSTGDAPKTTTHTLQTSITVPRGEWSQHLTITEVEGVRYLDEGNGEFKAK